MEKLFRILSVKPPLFEQTTVNMWDDLHISKGMLKAHLDTSLDSATRNRKFVEKSVEWICSVVPPIEYPKLLDLGCGPGIYTEMFKEKGFHVEGIDLSKRSIEYARSSALKKGLNIEYTIGDYVNYDFTCQYNIITLIYCDFGVLAPQIRERLLKKVYDALCLKGVLIFDVFTPLKYSNTVESKSWEIEENGFWHETLSLTLHSFYRYDIDNTFLNQYTVVTKDNEIYNYNIWEHTFSIEELKHSLELVGFKNVRFFGDVAGSKSTKLDHMICVLAEK